MTKVTLAQQLLRSGALSRVVPPGTDVERLVASQTDDEMFDSYICCSGCQGLFLSVEMTLEYMQCSKSADEGLDRVTAENHRNVHRHITNPESVEGRGVTDARGAPAPRGLEAPAVTHHHQDSNANGDAP